MPDKISFSRHDLLLLDKDSPVKTEPAVAEIIRNWLSCGRPVIVRRPCLTVDGLHCGIPLPLEQERKRLSFTVDPAWVKKRLSLPLLPELRWKRLEALAELQPEVFGSLAWQHLTGLQYLHEKSDVDLLFRVKSRNELRELTGILAKLDSACDIEIMLWNNRAFSWREWRLNTPTLLLKGDYDVFFCDKKFLTAMETDAELIAGEAEAALHEELETYPKPGLVSYADNGSHTDMDANCFRAGIAALRGYFKTIAETGSRGASMAELRRLGMDAEKRMLTATGGVNTHRGAIFTLGLLAAAAGYKRNTGNSETLGGIVKDLWGREIMQYNNPGSNGENAVSRYGGGSARSEAANGFPAVYNYGLPALKASFDHQYRNIARLNAFYAVLGNINDTTLLHRGGRNGHDFAVNAAAVFSYADEAEKTGLALRNHHEFVKRGLSCGGAADLLAATLFIHNLEELWPES
ncbi:MAG: malonate decarboxylase holo-[acyl-carrier-protein] synthase [Victivallales bacterium]|nr:malonate decarboxylase holo-[acyl-carrier-protein] synthase [Victivallales bacterium]